MLAEKREDCEQGTFEKQIQEARQTVDMAELVEYDGKQWTSWFLKVNGKVWKKGSRN